MIFKKYTHDEYKDWLKKHRLEEIVGSYDTIAGQEVCLKKKHFWGSCDDHSTGYFQINYKFYIGVPETPSPFYAPMVAEE